MSFGGKVAFCCDHWATGDELWVTDGTEEGTVRAFESTVPGYLGEVATLAGTTGGIFFQSTNWDLADSHEFFFSDGTPEGTLTLNPMEGESRARFSSAFGFVASGAWCYFIANDKEIWRSDGTDAGTTKVVTVTEGWPNKLVLAGDGRLFIDIGIDSEVMELWTCTVDGSSLTRLGPPEGTRWAWIQEMVASGDQSYMNVLYEDYSAHLWTSDGTPEGTREIRLMHQGTESGVRGSLTPWKDAIYLMGQQENGDYELWRTNAMSGGTSRLQSFPEGVNYLSPCELRADGDFLYFHAQRADLQWDLWRTQGDAASTRRVRGAPASDPMRANGPLIAESESGVFLAAGQGTPDEALWRLRGETAGSVRVTRPEKSSGSGIAAYPDGALPYEFAGGALLAFIATGDGHELWRMTPEGSRSRAIWKPPLPLQSYGSLGFRGTTATGALFTVSDGAELRQVWATDGTRRGTWLLGDHGAATDDPYPYDFVNAGGVWFYSVVNANEPAKAGLWKTDGTAAGTSKVIAADGSVPGPNAGEMVAFQGDVCFLATGVDGKTALWRSDGTATGTVRLKNDWFGASGGTAVSLSVAGGKLIFSAKLSDEQYLWESDGTTAGTRAVTPLATFSKGSVSPAVDLGGVAIFQAYRRPDPSFQWWRHDAAGTRRVRNYTPGQQMYPWYPGSRVQAVAGGRLFYTGLEDYQAELWVTDGTSDGTRRVKDLNPGPLDSSPNEMLAVGDVIYFSAHDEDHGDEVWRSDGTEVGTVLVADVEPGPASSWPGGLKVMNGKLYFSAWRRDVGRELHVIDLPPP